MLKILNLLYNYIVSYVLQETLARWHTVFWLAAGINMATNCFYLIFASATEQPWSRGSSWWQNFVTHEIFNMENNLPLDRIALSSF